MRVFSIDLGDQRTGLALGDRITNIASPIGLIEVPIDRNDGQALLDEILRQLVANVGGVPPGASTGPGIQSDTELLIGMPLNMDDSEGPRAKLVRVFAQRLANESGRAVILIDERRTSIAADARMAQTGLTHKQKKKRRDAIAAATIAQSYLNDPDMAIDTIWPMESA